MEAVTLTGREGGQESRRAEKEKIKKKEMGRVQSETHLLRIKFISESSLRVNATQAFAVIAEIVSG